MDENPGVRAAHGAPPHPEDNGHRPLPRGVAGRSRDGKSSGVSDGAPGDGPGRASPTEVTRLLDDMAPGRRGWRAREPVPTRAGAARSRLMIVLRGMLENTWSA